MTDQELIESLRLWNRDDAADRIEELVKERDELKEYIDRYSYTELGDEAEARCLAEAKLTKARTGLRKIADYKHFVAHLGWTQNAEARIASATLAELEVKE